MAVAAATAASMAFSFFSDGSICLLVAGSYCERNHEAKFFCRNLRKSFSRDWICARSRSFMLAELSSTGRRTSGRGERERQPIAKREIMTDMEGERTKETSEMLGAVDL